MNKLIILVMAAGLSMLGGCVYHTPASATYTTNSRSLSLRAWEPKRPGNGFKFNIARKPSVSGGMARAVDE